MCITILTIPKHTAASGPVPQRMLPLTVMCLFYGHSCCCRSGGKNLQQLDVAGGGAGILVGIKTMHMQPTKGSICKTTYSHNCDNPYPKPSMRESDSHVVCLSDSESTGVMKYYRSIME